MTPRRKLSVNQLSCNFCGDHKYHMKNHEWRINGFIQPNQRLFWCGAFIEGTPSGGDGAC
jgi:hypothetical protein